MSDIDTAAIRAAGICDCENLCDEIDRLRARLAEVEAAHTCAANLWAHEVVKVAAQRERAEAAEARLAAVLRYCTQFLDRTNIEWIRERQVVEAIRALATAENEAGPMCLTCQGRNRETTDMVCMTCGRDYLDDDPQPGTGWKRLMEGWKARAAEVEATDALRRQDYIDLSERLATVLAVCGEADRNGWHRNAGRKVRAAAQGDDR